MYIPNDWYNEFEDYKKEEFRGNEGIYDNFTDEQFEVIKGYFRWRTKKRFKELVANTSLAVKPKKAETLAKLMGNCADWVYDGCVDTGFLGASHCELGHALRYEHYALSPSSGRQIVFGVNCASDFFGIEPERLRKINSVQDEILEEIKFIAFIRNTGKQPAYVKMFYGDLMDVINVLRKEMNEAFGSDWNQQMANFLQTGLPWTKSMVQKFEYVHRGIYQQRLESLNKSQQLADLCGNDPKVIEFVKSGAANKNIFLIKLIVSTIAREGKVTDPTELKKRQALLRLAILFDETYTNLSNKGVADFSKFVNSAKEDVYYVKAANGERLATKGEIENKVQQLFIKEEIYLPANQYKMLRLFGWAIFGDAKMYEDSGCPDVEPDIEKVCKSGKLMASTLDWLNNLEELKRAMMTLRNHMEPTEYPDSAIDEIKADISIEKIVDYIYNQNIGRTNNKVVEIALDIADKCVYYNNYNVSVKQAAILRQAYSVLTGKAPSNGGTDNSDEDDIFKKINVLMQNESHPAMAKHSFAFKVMGTVSKLGRASDKQKAIIEAAYNDLVKSGAVPDVTKFNEEDKKTERKDNSQKNWFIEGDEDEDDSLDDNDSGDNSQVFIEEKGNKTGQRGVWKTSANALIKMPSISEISQALGAGMFKEDIINNES